MRDTPRLGRQPRGERGRSKGRRAVFAIAFALAAGLPLWETQPFYVTQAAAAPMRPAANAQIAVLDLVLLVDESGSVTPTEIASEKATVGSITQSLLNPTSRVTVVGFGGINNVTQNQAPTDVACVPTIASAANLPYLSFCVNRLHTRTEAEGDDTDYATALEQAMSYLSPSSATTPPSPKGALKIILMLVNGAADVHRDTQQYGTNWQLGEQTAVNAQLSAAARDDVQVWPVGFGPSTGNGETLAYLNNIAARGAQNTCGSEIVGRPRATWVNNLDDAIQVIDRVYADSVCEGASTTVGAATAVLAVTIPKNASDAVISVDRGNPSVSVSYIQPDGTPWSDASAISGQNTPVEVLHLGDKTPTEAGTWHVRLTASPGATGGLTTATVTWQAAVRALITASPSSATPGQPIKITLNILGPNGPITDPRILDSLAVGVTASGTSLRKTQRLSVSAVSGIPGEWIGTFTAPIRVGALTFTGTVAGPGIYDTPLPQTVTVSTGTQGFTAAPRFNISTSVQAGNSIKGQVTFSNQTGSARSVRFLLTAIGATATLANPPGPITVPSNNLLAQAFTITFSKNSPPGVALVRLEVADTATGQVYGTSVQEITVTESPGIIAAYFWVIISTIIGLSLLITGMLWRHQIRMRKDVRGLVATLERHGEKLDFLKAPDKWSDTFAFIVRDRQEGDARLDYPVHGTPVYTARRIGPGKVSFFTQSGAQPVTVAVNGPSTQLERNGLSIAFLDNRPNRGSRKGTVRRRRQQRAAPSRHND